MPRLLIFGPGYTAGRLARRAAEEGWSPVLVNRSGAGLPGLASPTRRFDDGAAVEAELARADAVLSSVPPDGDCDPVLDRYGTALLAAPARWIGYLSSTGVYGDTQGAWVDETSPVGAGRRTARVVADLAWQALHARHGAPVHIFRLPGIYGPGRSALDRVRAGQAHRIDLAASGIPGHVFSRIHVDDIVTVLLASLRHPVPGRLYNVADGEPASGNAPVEYACDLLGLPWPPLLPLDAAGLTPMGRAFYSECRRVRARRIVEELGVTLAYPDYRSGLDAIFSMERSAGRAS